MVIIRAKFNTKEEADMFWEGVSYVNDSSIELIKIECDTTNDWIVEFSDKDVCGSDGVEVKDYRGGDLINAMLGNSNNER